MIGGARWRRLRQEWSVLSYYQRFESSVTYWLMRERDDRPAHL